METVVLYVLYQIKRDAGHIGDNVCVDVTLNLTSEATTDSNALG